mmetsp:Transcript_36299/g.100764  ORF Transcript_36299/g.100764 Transcript_36299/m.100764 type:complete len:246 (-) Transcript_36299:474-1211(-)
MYIARARCSKCTPALFATSLARSCSPWKKSSIGGTRFRSNARQRSFKCWLKASSLRLANHSFMFLRNSSPTTASKSRRSCCSSAPREHQACSRSPSSFSTLISLYRANLLKYSLLSLNTWFTSVSTSISRVSFMLGFRMNFSSYRWNVGVNSLRPFGRPKATFRSSWMRLLSTWTPVFSESTSIANILASSLYSSLSMRSRPRAEIHSSALSMRPQLDSHLFSRNLDRFWGMLLGPSDAAAGGAA